MNKNLGWKWSLPGEHAYSSYAGMFAAKREYDTHCGIDFYCEPGQVCTPVENGVITKIEIFTGPNANPPSPWWHETHAIYVAGKSGVVIYGKITPFKKLKVGKKVFQGQCIGHIKTVLKKDKGMPMTMLHLELHKPGTLETAIWNLGEPQPESLLDPMKYFENKKNE